MINTINPFDFDVIGDGIHDDTYNFHRALHSLQPGDHFYAPNATYKLSTLDMTNIPNRTKIEINGKLKFDNNVDGINYKSQDSYLYIQEIEGFCESTPNYSTYNSTGILLKNLNSCRVSIDSIRGFKNGIKVIGDNAGTLYSEIRLRKSIKNETTLLIATSDDNPGYVNENYFWIEWMESVNGIEFKKGLAQIDHFNGNKFMFPGFEQITNCGMRLQFCRSNTIFQPRFENPMSQGKFSEYCIDEDNSSIYNTYHLQSYYQSKMNFNGKFTSVYGPAMTNTGDPFAYMMHSDKNYNRYWFGTNDSDYVPMPPDYVIFHKQQNQNPFEDCLSYIKTGVNTYKKSRFTNIDRYESIFNGDLIVNKNSNIIRVQATTNPVTLTMPFEKEYEGSKGIYLNITINPMYPITIRKSTGTISFPNTVINSMGVWELIYYNQNWHIMKISDKAFSE
jgi:hypothetical protein